MNDKKPNDRTREIIRLARTVRNQTPPGSALTTIAEALELLAVAALPAVRCPTCGDASSYDAGETCERCRSVTHYDVGLAPNQDRPLCGRAPGGHYASFAANITCPKCKGLMQRVANAVENSR